MKVTKMFPAMFKDKILSGQKNQTVRTIPKNFRLPAPGDIIHCRCWSGRPRTTPQLEFARFKIVSVDIVQFDMEIGLKNRDVFDRYYKGLEDFAKQDGFYSWNAMQKFFKSVYKDYETQDFMIIRWEYFAQQENGYEIPRKAKIIVVGNDPESVLPADKDESRFIIEPESNLIIEDDAGK